MRELKCDVAVIGGGTGGVAAALAACRAGKKVVLSEETDWIGGQLTAQSVPPDENLWIEQFGCTRSYRRLRDEIRAFYRRWYPLTAAARANPRLNIGGGWVSKICHEPRVAHLVIQSMLQPYLANGNLQILLDTVPLSADVEGDRVRAVKLQDRRDGEQIIVTAPYFLDATELGDLLPLTGAEFVMGAESRDQTGEPHALEGAAQPLNQQATSHCFAMSHHAGEDHTIARPDTYAFWRDYKADFWPGKNLSWLQTHPITNADRMRTLFHVEGNDPWESLWDFRQILEPQHFDASFGADSVTLVNWPQIDYWLGALVGVSDEERAQHLQGARDLSLCFFYWMQTAAPRHDGGTGYPGLRLRPDVTGTKDGLAKTVYVRESRRIEAEFTVLEQHVGSDVRSDGAEKFADSVGVGSYRIDLHPSTGASGTDSDGVNYIDVGCWPFQIPLGSLVPQRVENLLPACKNLGTTHITNGCYRLHPVEWNIGEAAGALAAYCVNTGESPRAIRNTEAKLKDFQSHLEAQGFELDWPQIHPH